MKRISIAEDADCAGHVGSPAGPQPLSEVDPIMLLRPNRFFEDLEVGEFRRSEGRHVREDEILRFAREYDPQWFHCDPEMAKTSIFGGIVASGVQTIALWRKMDHEINSDIAFACGLGWDEVRWLQPLRPNDFIYAESKLLDKRISADKRGRGYCRFASSVRLRDETPLLTLIGAVLVYRRASEAPAGLLAKDAPA